jgi:hypothetical protein
MRGTPQAEHYDHQIAVSDDLLCELPHTIFQSESVMTVHPKKGEPIVMSRQSKEWLACAAVLPAILLMASLGVAGAKVIWPDAPHRDSKTVFDADYVVGLAKLGIAKLPGFQSPPTVPIPTK